MELIIYNTYAELDGLTDQAIIDDLGRKLSYIQDSARYSFAVKTGKWDGRVRLLNRKMQFPAGLVQEVMKHLSLYRITPTIKDTRIDLNNLDPIEWTGPSLRSYQESAVEKAIAAKRGMMKLCTGAGKTNIIAKLCSEYNTSTVVYVVSLDLLEQVRATLSAGLNKKIGLVGGGNCQIEQITVCSVWSAASAFNEKAKSDEEDVAEDTWKPSDKQKASIREMVEGAKLIILDEAQFAAAESIQTLMKNSKSAANRFGFSGTPWRSDGADILLTAAFGHNICDVRASDLIDLGFLVPPRIAFKTVPQNMTLSRNWMEVKSQYIVHNEERNKILIAGLNKMLGLGRKPLVLFRDIKHGKILESMLPAGVKYEVVTGALDLLDRERIKEDFRNGKLDMLMASSVFDQGIDLTTLDGLILAGGGKSTAKALQRVGRVIRSAPGKADALILETWDQSHFVKKHSQTRMDAYKWESRFIVSTDGKEIK